MNILDYYQLTQKLTEMNMKKLSEITVNEYSKFLHPSLAQQLYLVSSVQKKKEIERKVD
jgi:hypothetical protein